jgi:hypothetical protein
VALDNKAIHPNFPPNANQNTLYIHWQHHPVGLQQTNIRRIYETTLQLYLPYEKMQIAISRPKNLRDILTRTAFHNAEKSPSKASQKPLIAIRQTEKS